MTGSSASPRTPGIPLLREAQAEALDAVHVVAKKHEASVELQPGDIRFMNNLGILHSRDSFDYDD